MATLRTWKIMLTAGAALALGACSGAVGGPRTASQASAPTQQAAATGGLLTIAQDMAAKGDHEAAIPLFRHLAATGLQPDAVTGLAASQLAMGNSEVALRLMEQAGGGKSRSLSSDGHYTYGKAALAEGRFDEALRGFSMATTLAPQDTRPRSGMAIALAANGEVAAAVAALHGASDNDGLSNKALVLAASGNAEDAIRILEPLMMSGSAGARDRQNLAMAYLLAGQENRAFQIARLDLDAASVHDTFTFYRSLQSLDTRSRMRALVTGTIDPSWTTAEAGNLSLENSDARAAAAERLVAEASAPPAPVRTLAAAPAPVELTAVPPLLEPEGWALQIGAYRTLPQLVRGWKLLYVRNQDILNGIPPRRSEVDFGKRDEGPSGFYYRLNAGPLATLGEARIMCEELKRRGTRCWIRPPEASEGRLPEVQTQPAPEKASDTAMVSR